MNVLTPGEPFTMRMRNPHIQLALGGYFHIGELFEHFQEFVHAAQKAGLVRQGSDKDGEWAPSDHAGWSVTKPLRVDDLINATDDEIDTMTEDLDFVAWYADGFGPDNLSALRYAANGARKTRGLLADGGVSGSTLEIYEDTESDFAQPHVTSVEENGDTLWGCFPWGGSVIVIAHGWVIIVGLSGYSAPQDHILATSIGVRILEFLHEAEITEIIERNEAA